MESGGVSLPLIHKHLMVPENHMGKGQCCGGFEATSDGYYCQKCCFFFHKKCSESSEYIQHPSHSGHTLQLRSKPRHKICNLCGMMIKNLFYRCEICDFNIDLYCARYPQPEVIDISEKHSHKLTLHEKRFAEDSDFYFDCEAKCGRFPYGFPYKCHECDLFFHLDCIWNTPEVKHALEVNHSYHSWHPLKLFRGRTPEYSDGKCSLCGDKIYDKLYYHCSSCNFKLDMCCILNPPPRSLLDLKVHDHQLTFLPRLDSFTCNACGLKGDRSPYVCLECGFMIHQDCLSLPRVINISRHDHRISRTSVLGVVNSVCGICRKKVDWTFGGYSCHRCHGYVVHSKCGTRKDVWNGKELEGVPEEIEDIKPYLVIDENTIQHFSHKEHYLRLHVSGVLYEESNQCNACMHPICLQSFYGCIDCKFILHKNCAEFPKKKWHVLHNEQLTLITSMGDSFRCDACRRFSCGFMYNHEDKELDLRCSSISEPFVHPSHSHHPLYYNPKNEFETCQGCISEDQQHVLKCIEDDCEFVLCFKCATLPQVVKHRVDDHPLILCYGSEEASGKCWCDICEKESDLRKWFYTCKDHRASLHTKCVLGDFAALTPRSTINVWEISVKVVLNDSISRPFCKGCKSHCMYPIILKMPGTSNAYICSFSCLQIC